MRDAQGLVVCDAKGRRKIMTRSKKMRRVLERVAACANSSATVLIEGESGTGKDLIAQALHFNSDRTNRPYLVVNCATLDEHFLKSELFGHERGAFTGAATSRAGLLEVADGGTLFIDEVGDTHLDVQAMLLRVIETGSFRKMGSSSEMDVDVRIIAATNKRLEDEVAAGRFRLDLFYRLDVLRISLPPLRDRIKDVPLLAEHFLNESRGDAGSKRFTAAAMKAMMNHSWPGNIRELRNVIEQALILSKGGHLLTERHLPRWKSRRTPAPHLAARGTDVGGAKEGTRPPAGDTGDRVAPLAEMEMIHIRCALETVGGNKTQAAKLLGISRVTLRKKITKYCIRI
jgi:two-component system response regulator HydG